MNRYKIVTEYNSKSHDIPAIFYLWDKIENRFALASEMFVDNVHNFLGCLTNRRQAIKLRNKLNNRHANAL